MTLVVPRKIRGYGAKPDLPDQRDMVSRIASLDISVPDSVTLSHLSLMQFPLYNQDNLGSCTANAIAANAQAILRKLHLPNFTPSRLAIYFAERFIENSVPYDSGAMIRDGFKAIAKDGLAPESLWPYVIKRFTSRPPTSYFTHAALHKATRYERVPRSKIAIQRVLASGYPIVFGFSVFESFETDEVDRTGIVPMPSGSDAMIGGHAVLKTGYDANGVDFRNSYGDEWGNRGYGRLPWEYVLDPNLTFDLWTLKAIAPVMT